ncbi:M3 family metallopeptidase [Actinomyces vulturis]|uniref:M3 family metallopeptidase n=1 Tax=Actinomyces vulturis TaxID=1857645 RepID=UPI0008349DFF|nr:M3 family metallopeptidase [Actinomyces vulturis]
MSNEQTLPSTNCFAQPWTLEHKLPDFAAVKHEDIEPAIRAGMAQQVAEWEAIASNEEAPTVENTVKAVELSGDLLERALIVLYSLTSATECPDLDELEEKIAPELSEHFDTFTLDARMYARYKALDEAGGMDDETTRLVRLQVEDFERAGVNLTGEDAKRLRELNSRITALESRFSSLATHAMHEAGTASFTNTPALATMTDHNERTELLQRSMARGLSGENDTRAVLLETAQLRAERATLLGFKNHAAVKAAESAAKTEEAVNGMLNRLVTPAMANARRDAQQLAKRMAEREEGEFGPQDWMFYEEAERKERFGVDDATLAPYLELWSVVIDGVFFAAHELYGLSFVERKDLAEHMYDPSVRVWEVRDGDGDAAPVLGLFVGDYFARPGKRGGAWMNELTNMSVMTGDKPVVINCLNVEAKEGSQSALLTWDEVTTAFHEFGHALHGLLSEAYYPSAAGANVPRDVVEFPSQFNESWALNPRVLASYARHHETGERIPDELIEQLRAQGSFGEGYKTTEYLGAALLDQAWHTVTKDQLPTDPHEVEEFEAQALERVGIDASLVPPRYRSSYFTHTFGGGYDAAYYAYVWSEVMDADMVAWMKSTDGGARIVDGVSDEGLNRHAGDKLRKEFLSRGDSRDPLVGYRNITGRDPQVEPLLKRRGLMD